MLLLIFVSCAPAGRLLSGERMESGNLWLAGYGRGIVGTTSSTGACLKFDFSKTKFKFLWFLVLDGAYVGGAVDVDVDNSGLLEYEYECNF